MTRLRRWHDKIKYMPAEHYYWRLTVYCCTITVILALLYIARGDNIYRGFGAVFIGLTLHCLDRSDRARKATQARNMAHDNTRNT